MPRRWRHTLSWKSFVSRRGETVLLLLLLVASIAIYALLVERGYIEPDEEVPTFRPIPTIPLPPPMPPIVTTREASAEDCERIRDGGACADDTFLERCTDAGTLETTNCLWIGSFCARDLCKPGAACCPPTAFGGLDAAVRDR